MGKRVKIFDGIGLMNFKAALLCAGLGLSLALAGCVSDNSSAEDVSAKPAQSTTLTQAKTIKTPTPIPAPKDFTTIGKPTKTVWTPWGEKDIYDPAQDPEIIAIFDKWYEANKFTYEEVRNLNSPEYQTFNTAERIHTLDNKRLGCEILYTRYDRPEVPFRGYQFDQITSNGFNSFSKNCGSHQTFGKMSLSKCEKNSLVEHKSMIPEGELNFTMSGRGLRLDELPVGVKIKLANQSKARGYYYNGFDAYIIGKKSYPSAKEQFELFFNAPCFKWRGIKPHMTPYSSPLSAPTPFPASRKFTVFERYSNLPSLEEYMNSHTQTQLEEVK